MSKHWRPDKDVLRARSGAGRRKRLPDGGKAGLVLVAAACVAIAIGVYQAFGPREVIAPGAEAKSDRPDGERSQTTQAYER